jgi:hypothetical protein
MILDFASVNSASGSKISGFYLRKIWRNIRIFQVTKEGRDIFFEIYIGIGHWSRDQFPVVVY